MPDRLDEVLRRAQDLGLLGPGDLGPQRGHAKGLSTLALADLEGLDGLRWLDLGSGGGLPGLAVAEDLQTFGPGARGVLLDRQRRRTDFLRRAVTDLGLAEGVEVVTARAEDAARDPAHRERYDLVIARSFAGPAVTAECAGGFLRPGGRLAVSEPPDLAEGRWDEASLALLALSAPRIVRTGSVTVALLTKLGPTPARYPRKPGLPQKRPLW